MSFCTSTLCYVMLYCIVFYYVILYYVIIHFIVYTYTLLYIHTYYFIMLYYTIIVFYCIYYTIVLYCIYCIVFIIILDNVILYCIYYTMLGYTTPCCGQSQTTGTCSVLFSSSEFRLFYFSNRRAATFSSRNFDWHSFGSRVSNPRAIAYFHFNMPFESSDLPGSGRPFEL